MAKNDLITNYSVRVLMDDGQQLEIKNLDYGFAKQRFLFYVSACLEFDNELHVRCVNIFRGDVSVKYYQNYSIRRILKNPNS